MQQLAINYFNMNLQLNGIEASKQWKPTSNYTIIFANMGSVGSMELVLYDYPPSEVALIAFDDLRGVSLPRLISV
jgi:hypothetical protein